MHAPTKNSPNTRYQLHSKIGLGTMGEVYRATDRLTGDIVALKRFSLQSAMRSDARLPAHSAQALRLTLASEFQILAGLRHPHIISVIDYGFDENRQPYFTMDYLSETKTILEAARGKSDREKVALLGHVLQALVYLHRRGILHRDLKPGNVLVSDGQLRVLDFGLSAMITEARGRVGTLAYMAPETLRSGESSEASDLYAVGILAYEIFAGQNPFEAHDIMGRLSKTVELASLRCPADIRQVIARLLGKKPADRYPNANAALNALRNAVGGAAIPEEPGVRESFLQAAEFIGREAELSQLMTALEGAQQGRGSIWFVEGESGVGKSRLLDEFRTRALVLGTQVLRGQGIEDSGQWYQLWQDPLRRLALSQSWSDLEAGVIKPLVPDLDSLLGRDIPDAPVLEGRAAQQRVVLTIADILRRAAQLQPLVLLLDDLQWATESIGPLNVLSQLDEKNQLLIIAGYRSEERPDRLDELSQAQTIYLSRFQSNQIAKLSTSMLGAAGEHPHVINFLQKETEGNIFFLVETVRALADEAGYLEHVGEDALPESVFTGGIQEIITRRLARVPGEYTGMLNLAAVAGRALDLNIFRALAAPKNRAEDQETGNTDIEPWLNTCADLAVLEVREGQWRFSHDKLRTALIDRLSGHEYRALHQLTAELIEDCYESELHLHYGSLAQHWRAAGHTANEHQYAKLAGEQAASQYAHAAALSYFSRALDLTPEQDIEERYALLLERENVYGLQGLRQAQTSDLSELETLAKTIGIQQQVEVILRQAAFAEVMSNLVEAVEKSKTAVVLSQSIQSVALEAAAYLQWSRALRYQDEAVAAEARAQQALALARSAELPKLEADSLITSGGILWKLSDFPNAQKIFQKALVIYRDLGDQPGEGWAYNHLGLVAENLGELGAAIESYEQALVLFQQVGNRRAQSIALGNLGYVYLIRLGDLNKARMSLEQDIEICRQTQDQKGAAWSLGFLSLLAHEEGDNLQAVEYGTQALAAAQGEAAVNERCQAYMSRAHAYAGLGRIEEAQIDYHQAMEWQQKAGLEELRMEALSGLAETYVASGDLETARSHISEILVFINTFELDRSAQPFRVYLLCYRILHELGETQYAEEILAQASKILQEKAALIDNEALRTAFLFNVRSHRELLAEIY